MGPEARSEGFERGKVPTIESLIREQASLRPHAEALRHGSATTDFLHLEEESNSFAAALLGRGVRPGDRVGLSLRRSLELPTAILGVLKAGAAYVPLDPAYPPARLDLMVQDSSPRLIVASSEHMGAFGPGREVLTTAEILAGPRVVEDVPEGLIHPDRPAYLIYTSGSTGTPKGVVMPHRALANLIDWQVSEPGFAEPARTLQFTPASFDVHYQEIFSTLAGGGTVVIVDESVRLV